MDRLRNASTPSPLAPSIDRLIFQDPPWFMRYTLPLSLVALGSFALFIWWFHSQ